MHKIEAYGRTQFATSEMRHSGMYYRYFLIHSCISIGSSVCLYIHPSVCWSIGNSVGPSIISLLKQLRLMKMYEKPR